MHDCRLRLLRRPALTWQRSRARKWPAPSPAWRPAWRAGRPRLPWLPSCRRHKRCWMLPYWCAVGPLLFMQTWLEKFNLIPQCDVVRCVSKILCCRTMLP